MREIKFRAWDKKKEQMANVIKIDFENWSDIKGLTLLECKNKKYWMPQDDVIFMQYTGLKDKNGKEIYEGDIVLMEVNQLKGIIKFLNGGFKIDDGDIPLPLGGFEEGEIEVIGNIYENPELLENNKKEKIL